MKLGAYNLGDFFDNVEIGDPNGNDGQPKMLSTAEAFVKPLLQLIQRFYIFNKLFDIDNEEESSMMIGGKFSYSNTEWGRKPTVIVLRGPVVPESGSLLRSREGWNNTTGSMTYKKQYTSTAQIMCISTEYAESIATAIFDLLDMAPREVAMAGINRLEGLTLGTEERVDGGAVPGLKMCIVSCKITTEKRWSETPTGTTALEGTNINGLC